MKNLFIKNDLVKIFLSIITLGLSFSTFVLLRVFFENTFFMFWLTVSMIIFSCLILLSNLLLRSRGNLLSVKELLFSIVLYLLAVPGLVLLGVGTIGAYVVVSTYVLFWLLLSKKSVVSQHKVRTFALSSVLIASGVLGVVIGGWIVFRAGYIPPAVPVQGQQHVVKLSNLTTSIDHLGIFLEGMYKDNGALPMSKTVEDGTGSGLTDKEGTSSVMSEYYALPVRIRTQRDPRYRMLGDTAVRVDHLLDGATSENSVVSFNLSRGETPEQENEDDKYFSLNKYQLDQEVVFNAHVEVDWNYSRTHIALRLRPIQRTPPRTKVFVRLGDQPLGWWDTSQTGQERTFYISKNSRKIFQSSRYTTRHATQGGEYFFDYNNMPERAKRLRKTLTNINFPKGYDLYAPIWNQDTDYSMKQMWEPYMYHDCKDKPTRTNNAYLYRSKICLFPIDVYRWLAVPDILIPTSLALHSLHTTNNPKATYRDLDLRPRTAQSMARRLEKLYRDNNYAGLTRCNPLRCEADRYSTIRLALFAALESELGYVYGDKVSQTYADSAIYMLSRLQVEQDGMVTATDRLIYYRPIHKGGFYSIYNQKFFNNQLVTLSKKINDGIFDRLDMPAEYKGIIPGNAETGLAVYGTLIKYRCLKYKVGCETNPNPLQLSTEEFNVGKSNKAPDVFKRFRDPNERKVRPEPHTSSTPQNNQEKKHKKRLKKLSKDIKRNKNQF